MVFNKIEDIVKQQETSIDGSRAEVSFIESKTVFYFLKDSQNIAGQFLVWCDIPNSNF